MGRSDVYCRGSLSRTPHYDSAVGTSPESRLPRGRGDGEWSLQLGWLIDTCPSPHVHPELSFRHVYTCGPHSGFKAAAAQTHWPHTHLVPWSHTGISVSPSDRSRAPSGVPMQKRPLSHTCSYLLKASEEPVTDWVQCRCHSNKCRSSSKEFCCLASSPDCIVFLESRKKWFHPLSDQLKTIPISCSETAVGPTTSLCLDSLKTDICWVRVHVCVFCGSPSGMMSNHSHFS